MLLTVNFLAVLLAATVGMLISTLWYSSVLFAYPWMMLLHLTEKEFKREQAPRLYTLMFIGTLLSAYVLAILIDSLKIDTVSSGIILGVMVWLGFVTVSLLPMVLFEQKPWKLYLLNIGHQLVVMVVMAAVLGVWK